MAELITFLGPPGSGKTTQAARLAKKLGYEFQSIGFMLRKIAAQSTPLGRRVRQAIDKGKLFSNKVVNKLVEKFLLLNQKKKGIVFDGFPRTLSQMRFLKKWLIGRKWPPQIVFYLKVSDATAFRRLAARRYCPKDGLAYPKNKRICSECHSLLLHRPDDLRQIAKLRLEIWRKSQGKILKYLRQQGIKVFVVDGEGSTEKVGKDILKLYYDQIKNS